MKGYYTVNGYMGFVDGEYQLFASESDYMEWMEEQEVVYLKSNFGEFKAETDFELSGLDADERREALEDAGLDPDNNDF